VRATRLAALALLVPLAACSGGAGPATREVTVTLTIRYSRFVPSVLEVRSGTTVRFVVRNLDPIAHELIVGDEAVQDVHERGSETHHGERPGEVSVPAGSTAETTYVFDGPGTVLLGCHLPGHWDHGMRGTVRVA
jgi:uncharacterized cupredoxin-like copper-binding protein